MPNDSLTPATDNSANSQTVMEKPADTAATKSESRPASPAKKAEPVKPASPAATKSEPSETAAPKTVAAKPKPAPKRKYTKKPKAAAKPKNAVKLKTGSKTKAGNKPKAANKHKTAAKSKTAPKAARKTAAKATAKTPVEPAIDNTVKGLKQTSKNFENGVKKFQEEWFGSIFEMGDLHIANVELHEMLEASREATLHGIDELNNEMKKFVEQNVENGLSVSREIMKAKSIPEMFEIQSRVAQDKFQAYLEHGRNLNTIATRTAHEAMGPVSDNWSETIEKFYKQMAP